MTHPERDPAVWGPRMWQYLHSLPRTNIDVGVVRKVLDSTVLPCSKCQAHFLKYGSEYPISHIRTHKDAETWLWRLHNDVNSRTGKPKRAQSVCDSYGALPRLAF